MANLKLEIKSKDYNIIILLYLFLFITEFKHFLYDLKMERKAVNVIKFNAKGLILLCGELSIEASFKIASKTVKAQLLLVTFS
jgi:hypothetical protein